MEFMVSGRRKLPSPWLISLIAFQGKIVGRGVLLDYHSYAKENGILYSAIETHLVTARALEACAKAQGLTLEVGDILFVRMGFVDWYENASEDDRVKALVKTYPSTLTGIRQGHEEVEWFWYELSIIPSCEPYPQYATIGTIISRR